MATFLEYYEREIMSRLTMADLILKTGQEPYDLTQMLSCLQLSKEQAEGLLETALVRGMTRSQFLSLLQRVTASFAGCFSGNSAAVCLLPIHRHRFPTSMT